MNDALRDVRIGVTRPAHKAQAFADKLRALGAEPVIMPTIAIEPPHDPAPLDDALRALTSFDWLLFTSSNAVRFTFDRLDHQPLPPIGVVGPSTAKTVEKHGGTVTLIPEAHSAAGLFAALHAVHPLTGMRVLIPQSAIARPELADKLREAGAQVVTPTAYRTVQPAITLPTPPLDAITFTSPSTAENFAAQQPDLQGAAVFAIGPTTAAACRHLGWEVAGVADPHTIAGLIDACVSYFKRSTV